MIDLGFGQHRGQVVWIVLTEEYGNVEFEAIIGGVNNEGLIRLCFGADTFCLEPEEILAYEFLGIPDYIEPAVPELDPNGSVEWAPGEE